MVIQGGFLEEIELSRARGRPTDRLGFQILAFCRSIATLANFGIPPSGMDDAVGNAALRCLAAWRNVLPEWTSDDAANYFAKTIQNALRDYHKGEMRRKKRESAAAEDLRTDRHYSRKGPR